MVTSLATHATTDTPAVGDKPVRLVIDTNVWLDIAVFDDPRTRTIGACLAAGAARAIAFPSMLNELALVLDYAHIRPRVADPNALLARVTEWVDLLAPPDASAAALLKTLPICRDPDDQKFLEAALIGHADWLISKDKALLKLARKVRGFQIASPQPALDEALNAPRA